MITSPQELVWRGRLHLGDQPGCFGDASYAGLGCTLPLTLTQAGPAEAGAPVPPTGRVTLVLETEHLITQDGYPGHEVVVSLFSPDAVDARRWSRKELHREELRGGPESRIALALPPGLAKAFLAVAIHVDTTAAPGLYNDFVVTRLSLESPNYEYVASFGFHA